MKVESVKIDSLNPDPSNARKHSAKNLKAIRGSLAKFGQQKPIVVGENDVVIAGNGTLEAAKELGWESIDIVRTRLTGPEAIAFALADNRTAELAEWDTAALTEQLKSLDIDLDDIGFEDFDFDSSENDTEAGDLYTDKVESPIYTPTGEKPKVEELFSLEKTKELLAEISKVDLPKEEKEFLKAAAQRHTVFRYDKIAEFYAHASPELQELMERSALVIIDFDKAIENGFVKLTKDLADAYEENPHEGIQ